LLPFGLDQMKRILSAAARHRNCMLLEVKRWSNRGIKRGRSRLPRQLVTGFFHERDKTGNRN
jgi:hypothetical protein